MTAKEFMKSLINGKEDILQKLLNLLRKQKINYCVIGGLAVNAYCEPVVSLDLDLVIVTNSLDSFLKSVEKILKIERFKHRINLRSNKSKLRIQIQTDERYQDFLSRTSIRKVLGYRMRVAALEDVLQGKIWAYLDTERRESKRQKDLADIFRMVETHPHLKKITS